MAYSLSSARFLTSSAKVGGLPAGDVPEVAFVGRSNVGKSSAINALTNQRGLARSSKTPGRTQLINFFELDGGARLVDLPGYGYAKVPERVRRKWRPLIEGYFRARTDLCGIILLMDVRHPLKEFDWQMLEWAQALDYPCHVLLTKADKLSRGKAKTRLLDVRRRLGEQSMHPSVQLFSATSGFQRDVAETCILAWLYGEAAEPESRHPE